MCGRIALLSSVISAFLAQDSVLPTRVIDRFGLLSKTHDFVQVVDAGGTEAAENDER